MSSSRHSDHVHMVNEVEEGGTSDDGVLLDHVRHLIVDLMLNGDREAASHCDPEHTRRVQNVVNHDLGNAQTDADSTARERMLTDKLAHVLVELAAEQVNLRLAASAGNALLEELQSAREEIDTLQDEVEATQGECDRFKQEAQRLRDQNVALENVVQRHDVSSEDIGPCRRRPSLITGSGRSSRLDSCERCGSREVEMVHLEHRGNELKRQFIELELTRERDQQRQRELTEQITKLRQCFHEQHVETAHAQQELECVATQLEEQSQELQRVQAGRDSLRSTTRRLEAENQELRKLLTVREELVANLEIGKARAVTQLQVAANRAQAETKRITETLQVVEEQFENARRRASGMRREVAVKTQEEAEGLEQLLQDALRQVTILRLENQSLRQDASETSKLRSRRRKTADVVTTAADVLASGSHDSTTSSFTRDSANELITELQSGVPPLEIEGIASVDCDASTEKSGHSVGKVSKPRRKVSLELNWGQQIASSSDITAGALAQYDDNFITPVKVYLAGEDEDADAPTIRMEYVNDHCIFGGAIEAHSPIVRLCDSDGRRITERSTGMFARVHEASIDELRREASESSPKSPIYLGLSFIACATAATAASLLARR